MRLRTTLVIVVMAGTTKGVLAQEIMEARLSWYEVVASTTTPVVFPNGVVEPGEGVRFSISLRATVNGESAIGQTTTFAAASGGVATIRGVGSMIYSLRGVSSSNTAGTWTSRVISPVIAVGGFLGNVQLNGSFLENFGGGQWIPPGGTANGINPVAGAFTGVWTPTTYSNRTVQFRLEAGSAAPPGQNSTFFVATGVVKPDPANPLSWYETYDHKGVSQDLNSVSIPISSVPAPGAGVILTGSCWAILRRRR